MRRHLIEGIFAFLLLIAISIGFSSIYLDTEVGPYRSVDATYLIEHPLEFEGKNITTGVTIVSLNQSTASFREYITDVGFSLICPMNIDIIPISSFVYIRGESRIYTSSQIIVDELHIQDNLSSPIRSIPGLIIILILVYSVYTFQIRRFEFIPRGDEDT